MNALDHRIGGDDHWPCLTRQFGCVITEPCRAGRAGEWGKVSLDPAALGHQASSGRRRALQPFTADSVKPVAALTLQFDRRQPFQVAQRGVQRLGGGGHCALRVAVRSVPGWEDSTTGNIYASHCLRGTVRNVHTVRTGIEYMMELARWYGEGKIKPVIDSTMPLAELKAAYAHMGTRGVKGKLVMVS
jgi:hypothetical protein